VFTNSLVSFSQREKVVPEHSILRSSLLAEKPQRVLP
jgi:hypothetical protein